MPYFAPNKATSIPVDVSPVGLPVFSSKTHRPVPYGSCILGDVEIFYSETKCEVLAIVWACEHFDIYIQGVSFTVLTDHKPLVHIWKKLKPLLCIARWALRLQPWHSHRVLLWWTWQSHWLQHVIESRTKDCGRLCAIHLSNFTFKVQSMTEHDSTPRGCHPDDTNRKMAWSQKCKGSTEVN